MAIAIGRAAFSLIEIGVSAPVGQTWEQATHSGSQKPLLKSIVGVCPTKKAELIESSFFVGVAFIGIRILLGQTAAHRPQRAHRTRKSSSERAPSGRKKEGVSLALNLTAVAKRDAPRADAPRVAKKVRRERRSFFFRRTVGTLSFANSFLTKRYGKLRKS